MVMVHGTIRGSRLTIAFSSLAWMRNTVELQHERAARHHPRPSRKEVPDTPHTNTHHHMTPHHMTSQYTTHTTSHHIEPSDWQQAGSGYTHTHTHTHSLAHSPAHDALQHTGLARGLRAHHHDLRQVERLLADGAEDVLQLVDDGDEVCVIE
jgi:hypothetical protein